MNDGIHCMKPEDLSGHCFLPIFEKHVPSIPNIVSNSCDGDNGDASVGDITINLPVQETYLYSICTRCGKILKKLQETH